MNIGFKKHVHVHIFLSQSPKLYDLAIACIYVLQWNLRTKDTGTNINPGVLSFIERLSLFSEVQNVFRTTGNKPIILDLEKCPLLRGLLYCVPISEGPLLEVSLYSFSFSIWELIMWLFYFCRWDHRFLVVSFLKHPNVLIVGQQFPVLRRQIIQTLFDWSGPVIKLWCCTCQEELNIAILFKISIFIIVKNHNFFV